MFFRGMILASGVTIAAMTGVAAIALSRAVPGLRLPTHFDAAGEADRFMAAPAALFLPVMLCTGLSLMLAILPAIEPMQHRLDQSAPLYRTAWAGLLAMMALIELHVAGPLIGISLPPATILAGVGILFIAIGNMLPKSRPGYFVGIRTPWTLTDPDNWVATHRLGSRTMMAGGAITLLAALLPISAELREKVMLAAIVIAVLPPFLYSFLYWHRTRSH